MQDPVIVEAPAKAGPCQAAHPRKCEEEEAGLVVQDRQGAKGESARLELVGCRSAPSFYRSASERGRDPRPLRQRQNS